MVLKRRLPSTLSAEKKESKTPSTQTPEIKVDASSKGKTVPPSNPFEAQQQQHMSQAPELPKEKSKQENKPKKEPSHPVVDALAEPVSKPEPKKEEAVADNPFSVPVPPKSHVDAKESVIPEKKEEPIDFDDPFATPIPEMTGGTDAWAEEPSQSAHTSPKKEDKPNLADVSFTPDEPKAKEFKAKAPSAPKVDFSNIKDKMPSKLKEGEFDAKTAGLGLVAASLIAVIGYNIFVDDKDKTAEVVSRWTGALQEVSEELPEQVDMADVESTSKAKAVLQPEAIVVAPKTKAGTDAKEPEGEDVFLVEEEAFKANPEAESESFVIETNVSEPTPESQSTPSSVVEFVDVPEDEVDQPIISAGDEEMPEDIGVIAKMQNAIVKAREEKEGVAPKVVQKEAGDVPAEDLRTTGDELSRQLEEELAEYRKILSGSSVEQDLISPEEFFGEKQQDQQLAAGALAGGAIPLPKPQRESALLSEQDALSRYGDNPYNLPVVPEPGQGKETIRTLSDFDMAIFDAPRTRVRMPKHVKPSLRATSFPPVLLLSTIPSRGVIAESNRRQGVLMIGESIEGWELIAVHAEYAEFKRGDKNHILTLGH